MDHFRGKDCVKQCKRNRGVTSPAKAITSTKLQKYIATVSETAALSGVNIDRMALHLGHYVRIHRKFYCLHHSTTQLAKVSKLLLAVDSGNLEQIVGKNLGDMLVEGTLTQSLFIVNVVKLFALHRNLTKIADRVKRHLCKVNIVTKTMEKQGLK